jgi:hypothetical protein
VKASFVATFHGGQEREHKLRIIERLARTRFHLATRPLLTQYDRRAFIVG